MIRLQKAHGTLKQLPIKQYNTQDEQFPESDRQSHTFVLSSQYNGHYRMLSGYPPSL